MKKNLKARVISFFMSFVMLFQLLPITVFAAMNPPTIDSVGGINVDQETNMGGAPVVIKGQEYSAQVNATGANLTYTAGVGSYMALPAGLTINSETGLISGNCTAENGRYDVYIEVSNPAGKAHAVVGMTVGDSTLTPVITTGAGLLGTIYKDAYNYFEVSINDDNGQASDIYGFRWSLLSGSLPSGMKMMYADRPTMNISGIPTETGTFEFGLKAENDFGSATRTYSITVEEGSVAPNIIEIDGSLGYGVVGEAYEYQLEATGTNSLEDPMLWSTDEEDFSKDSYDLGNGLSISKTGLITGEPENSTQVSFDIYAKNSKSKDMANFFIIIHDNGEATSVSVTPEIVVMKRGETKEFTVSLEGYGDVEQEAYWNFYYYDGSAFPQPTDSVLSIDGNTPCKSVILTVGEDEEREQFRVVAYSKAENGGVKGYATVILEKTELNSITGTSSLDEFLVEGGTLPDTSAPAMPILLDVGKNYNMETTWQKKNGENWIDCEVGDTIEQNGQYRLATTIIVEEEFEQYKPAASISLTIDGKTWTTETPITGVDKFHFRAFSPTFILENANSIFTVQPEDGDVNVNSTYTVNWGLKYEPDDAPIIQFNDNGNWTTLVSSANKTSTEVTVPGESSPIVRQCRVLATYQNASQDPFYVYSDEFTITWHGKYTITVINGAAYDAYDQMTDSASFGDTVMLKANDIDGKTFKNWSITGATVDDENAKNVYMVMPKNNVTAEVIYINNSEYTFVNQPQSTTLEYNEKYIGTWSLNFEPTSVQIEKYDQFGNWNYIAMATATGGEIDGYDFNVSNKYRIVAYNNGEAVYSDEFTVTWEEKTYTFNLIAYDKTNASIGVGGTLYLTTDKGTTEGLNIAKSATKYTDVTINAVAGEGYEFVEWKEESFTGDTYTTDANTTFSATESLWLYAIFQEKSTHTVTFNTNGGSAVDTQNISNGEKVTKPSNPTKDNATFFAWYKDAELTEKFDFESEIITEPTTIYAGWSVNVFAHTYNVTTDETNTDTAGTFRISGIDGDFYNQAFGCIEGKEYTITATPKEGYDFVGWKSGAKDGEVLTTEKAYTFIAPNSKLYAVFKKQIYTVTFNTNGGSAVDTQNIAKGEKVTKPSNPTKDNATFFAWYKDAEFTEQFNFESETITEPTTIYAAWNVNVFAHTYNVTTDETNTDTAGTFRISGIDGDFYNQAFGCIEGKEYTITATPKEGYDFVGWKSGAKDGEVLTTEKAYTFTAPSPKLYAVFSVIAPTGNIKSPEFDAQEKGYEDLTYKYITITLDNNGIVDLEHAKVELTGTNANAYEIDLGPKVLLKGPGTWTDKISVRPITGLEVGTYNATITLKYDCDKNEEYETVIGSANLTFTVNESQPQLQPITSIDVITSGYAIGEEITSAEVTTTTEGVVIASYEWHDNNEPSNKLESGIFEANTQYRLQVFLSVNDGYTVEGLEKTNVKIDGKETSYFTNPCIGVDADNGDVKIYHYLDMLEAPTTYTVSVSATPAEGGTVAGGNTYEEDAEVTVIATANEGYTFVNWTESGSSVSTEATYTFTATADRTLVAVFEEENYTTTVNNGTVAPITAVVTGTEVTITANEPETGKEFDKWTVVSGGITLADETSATTTFTMGTSDVVVTATYKNIQYWIAAFTTTGDTTQGTVQINSGAKGSSRGQNFAYNTNVTLTAEAAEGFRFVRWDIKYSPSAGVSATNSNNPTTVNALQDYYYYAVFEVDTSTKYTTTVNSGTATPTQAAEGVTVTITAAEPESGKEFDKWTVVSGGITLADETSATTTFTMGTANVEVTANYKDVVPISYTTTVNNGTATPATAVVAGTEVTITANEPETGKEFDKWVVNAGGVTLTSETSTTTTFTMGTSDVVVTAIYKNIQYWIAAFTTTGDTTQGTVQINSGAKGSSRGQNFAYNTNVTLTAEAAEGFRFVRWDIKYSPLAGVSATNSNNPTTVNALQDYYYYAVFEADPSTTYTTTVNNGTVAPTTAVVAGTEVTITAAAPESGKEFDKWTVVSGGITLSDETSATTTFTMGTANVEVTANYKDVAPVSYTTTVNNGTVTPTTAVVAGTEVTITANEPETGKEFDKWTVVSGGITLADETASETTFTMGTSDVVVTATYKNSLPTYIVTFNSNGGSAVAAIENVTSGSTIAKPTNPTKSGYTFVNWYKEAELTNEFNFATDTITENTTLFAKWNKKQTTGGGGGGGSTTTKYTITVKQNDNGKISPETTKVEKGDNQKFEIKADKGYEVEKVLVDGKSVGAVTEYTFEKVKEKHTIEATFKKVEEVTEETWKNPFTDVTEDDWFYEAVKYANENKLFNGVSSTEFGPNVSMTRAMLVTVLYRLEGEPATNRSIPFADVDMSMYYANAVIWAKQNNIVNGVDETNFAPNLEVTREQLVTILYRYAQYKGKDVSVGENTNILSYDDFSELSEYAIPGIAWACGSGIITGRTISTIAPKGTATRAEVATMLMRFTK